MSKIWTIYKFASKAKCYRAKTEDEASLFGLLAEAAACDKLARKIEK
jgi:hypothetical protein